MFELTICIGCVIVSNNSTLDLQWLIQEFLHVLYPTLVGLFLKWLTKAQKRKKEQKEWKSRFSRFSEKVVEYDEDLYRFPILFFDWEKITEKCRLIIEEGMLFAKEAKKYTKNFRNNKELFKNLLVFFRFNQHLVKFIIKSIEDDIRKIKQTGPNPNISEDIEYLIKSKLEYAEHEIKRVEKACRSDLILPKMLSKKIEQTGPSDRLRDEKMAEFFKNIGKK